MVLPWSPAAPVREGLSGSLFPDKHSRINFQSQLKPDSRLLFSDSVTIQNSLISHYEQEETVKFKNVHSAAILENMTENIISDVPSLAYSEGELRPLLLEAFSAEQNRISRIDYGRNKLAVLANPLIEGSFAFASAHGNKLLIKHVQELDIDNTLMGLMESDCDSILLPHSITQLQSSTSYLAAASNEEVSIYNWTDSGELIHSCTQSFAQEQIKFFAANPIGQELALLHPNSLQITTFYGENKRSVQTRSEYSCCTFVNSSSVVALAGHHPIIELADLRTVCGGLKITDIKAPFTSVTCLTLHQSDSHLLAASCKVELNSHETRIYDIRYPKESCLNLFVSEAHSMLHYGNFSSSSSLKNDLIALDERGKVIHYGLERNDSAPNLYQPDRAWTEHGLGFSLLKANSKPRSRVADSAAFTAKYSNYNVRPKMDLAVLSLSGITIIPNESNTSLHLGQFKDPFLTGFCVNRSAIKENRSMVSYLASDGRLSCRYISREAIPSLEVADNAGIGEIFDYSRLLKTEVNFSVEPASQLEDEDFAPLKGVGRYLDFYWDEQKVKIFT